MKVALVCDWLTNVGGAEKVLLSIHKMFPDAPIYTSQYNPRGIDWFLDADVRVGWMRIFPTKLRRFLAVFRTWYFRHLDLSEYDLVISVTGAEAKGVKVREGARHICYCHVPTQYYWQMYDEYMEHPGFSVLNPLVRLGLRILVKPLRKADLKAAGKVTQFVTISEYAKELILKYYKRESVVVNPPVEVVDFRAAIEKSSGGSDGSANLSDSAGLADSAEDYYITTSRQVTWKRIDLAVKACAKLKRKLLVIGEGPEHQNLVKLAKGNENIRFLPTMKKTELAKHLANARGYLFPSLEPFGIAPVEALAAGCPVLAFEKGGAKDYVVNEKNGILFEKQTEKAVEEAILKFEKLKFSRKEVSRSAEKFSEKRFRTELMKVINDGKK